MLHTILLIPIVQAISFIQYVFIPRLSLCYTHNTPLSDFTKKSLSNTSEKNPILSFIYYLLLASVYKARIEKEFVLHYIALHYPLFQIFLPTDQLYDYY